MGYSIMTTFTKSNQKKMFKFLENNFRDWTLSKDGNVFRGPTDDVSYNGNLKILIGFDYPSWAGQTPGVAYAFRICYWMAKMTGRNYVVYDGCERWLLTQLGVDEIGFKPLLGAEIGYDSKNEKKYNKIIKSELQRLTKEYHKEN